MTEGELKLKAGQSAPEYLGIVARATYISAYIDGFEECQEENKNKFNRAKQLLRKCLNTYIRDPELRSEIEEFLKEK